MKISLVASSNGLGHARRLLNLIPGFVGHQQSLLFFITSTQAAHLESEMIEIKKRVPFKVFLCGQHGIDGSHFRDFANFEEVTAQCKENIADSDLVLSDNSLWPAKYSDNFYLFGHFNWVNFYQNHVREGKVTPQFLEQFQMESALLQKCKARFSITDFMFSDNLNLRTIDVPLLRYTSDRKTSPLRGRQIWIAAGTTKKNIPDSLASYSNLGELRESETWKLSCSKELPFFILGRPGLGSIRDCLAHQTYFHPVWSGIDGELASNELHLKRLGLNIEAMQDLAKVRVEMKEITNRIDEFWTEKSASPSKIVDLILSSVV